MTATSVHGRRERNKQEKLRRIIASASELFAKHGVDDVTTLQIAAHADIGTGTLFLYAKTKGELLLMVQNAHYADALAEGRGAAAETMDVADAVMAILRPIISCNRVHVGNGRTYLREMIFGDPEEPHHATASSFVEQMDAAVAFAIQSRTEVDAHEAMARARAISAVLFVKLSAAANVGLSINELLEQFRRQIVLLLPGTAGSTG